MGVGRPLKGNPSAVEHWHATLYLGVTANNQLCHKRFLLLTFLIIPAADFVTQPPMNADGRRKSKAVRWSQARAQL